MNQWPAGANSRQLEWGDLASRYPEPGPDFCLIEKKPHRFFE